MSAKDETKFMLRLPSPLKNRVQDWAVKNGRSMNAEIVYALEKEYPLPPEPESLNKKLAIAARDLVEAWSGALKGLGQDPKENHHLKRLQSALDAALKDY